MDKTFAGMSADIVRYTDIAGPLDGAKGYTKGYAPSAPRVGCDWDTRRNGISTRPDASRLVLTAIMFRCTLSFVEGGPHGHSNEEGRTQHEGQCV
jgi:hypothetical protein